MVDLMRQKSYTAGRVWEAAQVELQTAESVAVSVLGPVHENEEQDAHRRVVRLAAEALVTLRLCTVENSDAQSPDLTVGGGGGRAADGEAILSPGERPLKFERIALLDLVLLDNQEEPL